MITDSEHNEWIKAQRCYLCSPKSAPRGPSDPHHVGDGVHPRRSLIARIPACRHHHELLQREPYLEELLRLRDKVAPYYLALHKYEKDQEK